MVRERVHHPDNDNIYAEVMAHSRSPAGDEVGTLQVQGHRFILSEFNTHRRFSRNSASSRAIPVKKQIDRVLGNPAVPLVFPGEQRGMQGGEPLSDADQVRARELWLTAMRNAVTSAVDLSALKVHKSVVNRILEPFMWHTIIVSATDFSGFFQQRCSPLAQPEIRAVAECMQEALDASKPDELEYGQWHRPYIRDEDEKQVGLGLHSSTDANAIPALNAVSAARCARVSYLTQEGVRDMQADLDLFERLVDAEPPHWSPLEHVATPTRMPLDDPTCGNFYGWSQLRGIIEMERAAA